MADLKSPGQGFAGIVSDDASRAFAEALPRLLTLVNDKFSVDARLFSRFTPERLLLLSDAHEHFGKMLRAVLEFSLYEHMLDEFRWYVSSLSSRGLGEEYFLRMVEGWIIAIHAALAPVEAREVSRPLEWLALNSRAVYRLRRSAGAPLGSAGSQFLALLLGRKRRDAVGYVLDLIRSGENIERVITDVILRAMGEVGRLWEANEISVSDEHAATEISRYAIQRLMEELAREKPLGLTAVVGCVPGEQHDIGALLTAGYFEAKGWDVVYLGRSTPEKDLIETVARGRPQVCVFSITLIARLPASRDLFMKIRESVPGTKIVAGGHAAEIASVTLSQYVDAVARTIREANEVALKLVRRNA